MKKKIFDFTVRTISNENSEYIHIDDEQERMSMLELELLYDDPQRRTQPTLPRDPTSNEYEQTTQPTPTSNKYEQAPQPVFNYSGLTDDVERLRRDAEQLKRENRRLKRYAPKKRKRTEADRIYDRLKAELEKEHYGEIIAIDTELGRVVGIGDTLSEAYEKAKKATRKKQFAFKRVGYSYIGWV
jgi:hypothetical protein